MTDPPPARIALAGAGGYGATHLRHLQKLHESGRAALVAVCDVSPPAGEAAGWLATHAIPWSADFDRMVAGARPEVVVVATPPHLHASMLRTSFAAGCDVLVEKPPVVTVSQLDEVVAAGAGHLCQVGFQALGSWAAARLRELIASGDLGDVDLVSAGGCWTRGTRYYARAPWAGRKRLDGWTVNDGALTNPFAHAVMACLAVAGIETVEGAQLDADLYRAHDIEAHDTGSVRLRPPGGPAVLVATTLCAATAQDPWLSVRGSRGRARWRYLGDSIEVQDSDGARTERGSRTELLEDLLAARSAEVPELLVPLSRTRAFVELTEYLSARAVRDVSPGALRWRSSDGDRLVEIVGVEASTRRATEEGLLYREAGAGWAV